MSTAPTKIDACWNRVGIWGNEQPRCPELEQVVHCHNCSIYSDAGRRLLDRIPPQGYTEEWTRNLGQPKQEEQEARVSVIVFRLGNEWFALPTQLLREITEIRTIHSVPHNSNRILKGMINIRGELQLCVSLGYLFGLERGDDSHTEGRKIHERMIVARNQDDQYAFPVNEALNIYHYHADQLQPAPSTITNASATFITGILECDGRHVGCLDAELLFHALKRSLV